MLGSIRNIFSIPDLRKRVIFTLMILAVYRIGAQIPNPGLDGNALAEFWEMQKGTIFGMVDLFTGRNMSRMTIFLFPLFHRLPDMAQNFASNAKLFTSPSC